MYFMPSENDKQQAGQGLKAMNMKAKDRIFMHKFTILPSKKMTRMTKKITISGGQMYF